MRTVLKMFFRVKVANPWIVILCLLLGGLAGGIGIMSLLPLLALAVGGEAAVGGQATRVITGLLSSIGVQPSLVPLLMLVFLAISAKSAMTLLAMRYVGNAAAEVTTELQAQLIQALLGVRWSFFTSHPVGYLVHGVGGDAGRAATGYLIAASFLSNTIQALVYIISAFFISWPLALLAVVFGTAIAFSLQRLIRIAKEAGKRQTQQARELMTFFVDALNNIKPLKAMARQDQFAAFFNRKLKLLRRAVRREVFSGQVRKTIEEILIAIVLCTALYISLEILSYDLPKVLVMAMLLSRTMSNIGRIQADVHRAAAIESSFIAYRKLLATARGAKEWVGGSLQPQLRRQVSLDSVHFSHGDTSVLRGISIDIPVGQTVVLTGPSGAGKTTIVDLIVGLQQPQQGQILVDGTPLNELDLRAWRRMIGYVPQEIILLHDSLCANVTLGDPTVSEAAVIEALKAAEAWEFVSALPQGIWTEVGEKGVRLSGGQRQRIALARALALRPRLIILDEVTSALDPETELAICRSVRTLPGNVAILAITHRPAFLDVADRVYRIEDGQAEEVTPQSAATPA